MKYKMHDWIKNKYFKKLFFIFLTFTGFMANNTYAACTNNVSSVTLNFGTIIVQRDALVGNSISNKIYGNQQTVTTCNDPSGNGVVDGMVSTLSRDAISYAENAVFDLLPQGTGIGIVLGINGGFNAGQWDDEIPSGANGDSWGTANGGGSWSWTFQPTIQFIKISTPVLPGTINQQVANYKAYYGPGVTGTYGTGTPGIPIPVYIAGTINVVACSITTPNLVFPIGNILASTFSTSIGTTPSAAQNIQNLGLNCDAGANINVTLSGTQNPDVGTTSVLALTGQGGANVAKGVGVQIIYNGTPLTLNNRIVLKKSAGGQETFPLIARYYQTKTAVTTGTANASATLNLTYQ